MAGFGQYVVGHRKAIAGAALAAVAAYAASSAAGSTWQAAAVAAAVAALGGGAGVGAIRNGHKPKAEPAAHHHARGVGSAP
jgi:hypothetical protein